MAQDLSKTPQPVRILVDGKNLSLKTGTGIATYARNVCSVAKGAGHHVDVLYGEPSGFHRNPVLREIDFFDAEPEITPWRVRAVRDVRAAFSHVRPARAFEVPFGGTVVTRQFAASLPQADRFWNASNVFYNADVAYARPFRFSRGFSRIANVFSSDIAHWTYPMPVRLDRASNIYTIHDLVPLRLPFATLDQKRVYFRMIDRICREADAVITVSENSRRDVLNLFGVAPEKVVNTYQSVEIPNRFLELDQRALSVELEGLHDVTYKGYILFYGAIEPKKNVGRLIEAYLASGIDIPLLLVGKDGWLFKKDIALTRLDNIAYEIERDGITRRKQRIRRLDYVSFPQLVNLIRGARLVALPSLYEGFGLPIIESMICGTPVLTSNSGATAEVAGEAALLIDPYDTRDIRDGLAALSQNDELAAQLVAAGHRRVGAFAPERHAQRLSSVYDKVVAARKQSERSTLQPAQQPQAGQP